MTKSELQGILIDRNQTVKQAMKQLEDTSMNILFAVDESNALYGSLVDGDIRRWILDSGSVDACVGEVCNREPFIATQDYDPESVKRLMLEERISSLPILDGGRQIVDLITWDSLFRDGSREPSKPQLELPVVIMAGGMGTRLDPFTTILPKPLIPLGEKTALEMIVDSFLPYGLGHFYFSVFHKARVIRAYFEELQPDYQVEYLEEDQPLGTAGGLKLLRGRVEGMFLVANCDNIFKIDYADLVNFHRKKSNLITVVASMKQYNIPYGICEIENGGTLTRMVEKPEYSFLVNTGMYVLESEVLARIPDGRMFHITELIETVKTDSGRVGVYPIGDEAWLDIGEWAEYKQTVQRLQLS